MSDKIPKLMGEFLCNLLIRPLIIWWLWNLLVTDIWSLPHINYGEAMGLFYLFGTFLPSHYTTRTGD